MAQPAIKGFRLQTLYALKIILQTRDDNYQFRPEGREDLDIHHKGKGEIQQLIQVKALTDDLVFSDLYSKEGTSFLKRAESYSNTDIEVISLISFGPIGKELMDFINGNKDTFEKKLASYDFEKDSIEKISSSLQILKVDEETVREEVLSEIKNLQLGGDSEVALGLLSDWLLQISEESKSITRQDLISQIGKVGEYIRERNILHENLGSSIRILREKGISNEDDSSVSSIFN
ncbi:MAG: hypothetical protein H6581_12100 [Bacteroidia bacterium]|nr:hypothetical protein [Bacteroidia bacterium]